MSNGGLMVAIIGGDGAGKTTMVEEILSWLGKDFSIKKYHMGKPDWSILTFIIRGLLKIGNLLGFYPFQRADIQYTHNPDLLVFPGYPWLVREVCTARDRYLTYKSALRYSSAGSIAILDRFPLQEIKLMDSAQVARMTTQINKNRFILKLLTIEEQYYKKIIHPDLFIVLRVDPEIAVHRKKDEPDHTIRPRSSEIWEMNWKRLVQL